MFKSITTVSSNSKNIVSNPSLTLDFNKQFRKAKTEKYQKSDSVSDNLSCYSCNLKLESYCTDWFKGNLSFHVACTDLSHENFLLFVKKNGGFCACVDCRKDVIGHQSSQTKKFQSRFQQSVAGIREDLQIEITELKTKMLINIEEISSMFKSSQNENVPQRITKNLRANAAITSQSDRGNKLTVYGEPEESCDTMATVFDGISHDK